MNKVVLVWMIMLVMAQVNAGVIIESIDNEGGAGRVMIEGTKARIQSEPGSYMLLDLVDGKVSAIDSGERIVMDMDSPKIQSAHASEVAKDIKLPEVSFLKKAAGPMIAGYKTTQYQVLLDKEHCFDEYLALKPLEHSEILRFVKMIAKRSDAQETLAMRMAMGGENLCESVEDMVDDYYVEKGIPMRTVNATGIVIHEIKSIDIKAAFPEGTFSFPEDYDIVTRETMMQRAMQEMSPHVEAMPGKSPEEQKKTQEQMRQQLQELMKHEKQ